MAATLYQPPRKPLLSGRFIMLLLVLGAIAAAAYLWQQNPGWLGRASVGLLNLFGRELVTVEVATVPTRADVLLDGERMTELPLHVPHDGTAHQVTAVAPGYEPSTVSFRADGDRHLILTLRPSKGR